LNEASFHSALTAVLFAAAVMTWGVLSLVTAPYGRHVRKGWGPTVSQRWAWMVMESPAVLAFAGVYSIGHRWLDPAPLALFALWQLHYVHRTFVYPLRIRGNAWPVTVIALGFGFQCVNSYLNARQLSELGAYPIQWLLDPRFIAGAALFGVGMWMNRRADAALRRLRSPGETGYRIPRGGLFERVSCPNYLGEILEWFGWAVATWSWAGLAFAVYTLANLGPRAVAHHRWYQRTFPDYPADRRALIPFLW
jgi:3-oxo-5-alpha-steroid 4-dehydrogenase 1